MAAEFAAKFDASEVGRLLGLAHDLGKADQRFQNYLKAASENRQAERCPHAIGGSCVMAKELGPLALAVIGHHTGLIAIDEFSVRAASADSQTVKAAQDFAAAIGIHPKRPTLPTSANNPLDAEMLIRMSFSALVDADYLDTEHHMRGNVTRGKYPPVKDYAGQLREYVDQKTESAKLSTVNEVRRGVLEACRGAAGKPQGAFRLTVPTGGGKTLSGLTFALEHAQVHNLDRVIVAIPFTSIIEQTADQYTTVFGSENILEHHSALDFEEDDDCTRQLSAENWDCPLIVTTTVQLFESLLSKRPSHCRKLHNIARSVLVLDEVQMLPPHLLETTLDVLRQLIECYGVTVLFSTATQPDWSDVGAPLISEAVEIIAEPKKLFDQLRRVQYSFDGTLTPEQVATALLEHTQALAVFNTKKDAALVYDALEDSDALYLSTSLCGAHRRKVLEAVKARMSEGKPCRLVSTQVVEAGVDLDFPVVFRAMGPLSSIVQVAGRCNREGNQSEPGICHIFELTGGGSPKGAYRTAIDLTRSRIDRDIKRLDMPDVQSAYFHDLYRSTATDAKNIQQSRERLNYPKTAELYRLIDKNTTAAIVLSYAPKKIEQVLAAVHHGNISPRYAARKLSPYQVNLFEHQLRKAVQSGDARLDEPTGFYLWIGLYDKNLGISGSQIADPSDLII